MPPTKQECPHCGKKLLAKTTKVAKDTSGKKVTVWACSSCHYTEGHPVGGG